MSRPPAPLLIDPRAEIERRLRLARRQYARQVQQVEREQAILARIGQRVADIALELVSYQEAADAAH